MNFYEGAATIANLADHIENSFQSLKNDLAEIIPLVGQQERALTAATNEIGNLQQALNDFVSTSFPEILEDDTTNTPIHPLPPPISMNDQEPPKETPTTKICFQTTQKQEQVNEKTSPTNEPKPTLKNEKTTSTNQPQNANCTDEPSITQKEKSLKGKSLLPKPTLKKTNITLIKPFLFSFRKP
jgi:hypothetical protein